MPETTASALQQLYNTKALIRKFKRVICCVAPTTVDLPDEITGETGAVLSLPETWFGVGLVSQDGFSFAREPETSEVRSAGYASATRNDTDSITRTVTFTPQEFGRRILREMYYGVNLSAVAPGANGEISFAEPDLPLDAYYRMAVLGFDGPLDEEWIVGKMFPRVKVTNTGEEVWGNEDATASELTVTVEDDDEYGFPVKHFLGGTGAIKHLAKLGYTTGG